MNWFNRLFLTALFTLLFGTGVHAAVEVQAFDNEQLRERYQSLVFQLRCPKCDNQAVGDSNAPISVDIRQKTYEMLHQGYTDKEIVSFMIDRYTDFVTYKPRMSLFTIWLWLLPGILLLVGLWVLWSMVKNPVVDSSKGLTADESARLKKILEE